MSWNIEFAGTPEEVVKQLKEESNQLDGNSKKEYDAALPFMIGLVNQNYGNPEYQVKISGYGHGGERYQAECPSQPYAECTVSVKQHDPLV